MGVSLALRALNFFVFVGSVGALDGCSSDDPAGPTAVTGGAGNGVGGATGGVGTGGSVAGGGPSAAGGATGGAGTGGSPATGGVTSAGGAITGGAGTGSGGVPTGGAAGAGGTGTGGASTTLPKFSFFVTSLEGMRRLAGANGFGGNLKYGTEHGLTGADKICTELAESSMPGAAQKGWRAFLSVAAGPQGSRVDAIDRIGEGPWYDRRERIVAMNKSALQNARPQGAHADIVDDLPNEFGIPNHQPDPTQPPVDNHHILTGSDTSGRLYQGNVNGTCSNWSALANAGRPRIGFSWPAANRVHWISGQDEGGCGAGVNLAETGGSNPANPIVGSGGGYGGIYCFALTP